MIMHIVSRYVLQRLDPYKQDWVGTYYFDSYELAKEALWSHRINVPQFQYRLVHGAGKPPSPADISGRSVMPCPYCTPMSFFAMTKVPPDFVHRWRGFPHLMPHLEG